MTARAPQEQDKYIVRFPEGMREHLKEAAARSGRSLNAEIVTRLEASFAGAYGAAGNAVDQVFVNAMQALVEGPQPIADQFRLKLLSEYADYQQTQTQSLRQFLDLVSDIRNARDGKPSPTFKEETQRAVENEFARIRSWANAWGYEVTKK